MNVLLCVHHKLDPNSGAPGATLDLGDALVKEGCNVEYFSYDQAFPNVSKLTVRHGILFPWALSRFLRTNAHRFDIVDASTRDSWLWAKGGRPGAGTGLRLVTRSHGLEHIADQSLRESAKSHQYKLSWKYPIYHGGYKLWEARTSITKADHFIALNADEQDYVVDQFGLPINRSTVIPLGIHACFFAASPPEMSTKPLMIAFLGRWFERKGSYIFAQACAILSSRKIQYSAQVIGAGQTEFKVLADFESGVREAISVIPKYAKTDLPDILSGIDIFVLPSYSEGFCLSLVEAMACGLAPISTSAGVAQTLIRTGVNGIIAPMGDAGAVADAVEALNNDRTRLLKMRIAAQQSVQCYTWPQVAKKTIDTYKTTIAGQANT